MRTTGKLVGFFLSAALLALPVQAKVVVDVGVAPPPLRVEPVPAPRAGFVWAPGHWYYRGGHYVWGTGRWIAARPGWHWAPGAWGRRGARWHYVPGHWAR
jgi:hypothetical protein